MTSGHCTEWQNLVTMQVSGIGMLQRRSDPCLFGSVVAMLIMPWKNPFLQHNPCNWLHIQVKRHSSWCVQAVAAIANDESLQVRVRKSHPPEGRSSRHPSAHKGAKTGCVLTLRSAASLQKHCSVACKARVKQVRPWTYPSMVYVPLCTKLVMSDINRGN